ncbi:MAG: FecCD family ABC transporter permease [Vicinamibacterales bacterium]
MLRHAWLPIVAVITVAGATALGPRGAMSSLMPDDPIEARILSEVRLPRVTLGFLAGAALAVAGMAFQALFRNALATPYTLGVSAGASLGAAIYVHLGIMASVAGIPGYAFAALAGALLAIALVYAVARATYGFSSSTLLLAGVAISFLFTSVILAIQYIGDVTTSFRIGRWLLGGLEVIGFLPVIHVLPFAVVGIAILLAISRDLDLLVVGEESAAARGVSVTTVKKLVFAAASLMVGGVVATCGPIGFVGLVVPHTGRLVLGPRHRTLGPFSVLAGGTFLVACDAVGRTVVAPVEIPVGIITALIGGPFFLVMLVQGHARQRFRGSA